MMNKEEGLLNEFGYCRYCKLIKPIRSINHPSMCKDCAVIYDKALEQVEFIKERKEQEPDNQSVFDEIFKKGEILADLIEKKDKLITQIVQIKQELDFIMEEAKYSEINNEFLELTSKWKEFWILDPNKVKRNYKMIYDNCYKLVREKVIEVKRKQT